MTIFFSVLFLTGSENVKTEYLEHLRYIICGAAPLGALDEERFLTKARKDENIFFQGTTTVLYFPISSKFGPFWYCGTAQKKSEAPHRK